MEYNVRIKGDLMKQTLIRKEKDEHGETICRVTTNDPGSVSIMELFRDQSNGRIKVSIDRNGNHRYQWIQKWYD